MLQGYLIEKYTDMSHAYTCNRLVEEAERLSIKLSIIGIHDVMITEAGVYHKGIKLSRADFVINRYKWGFLKDSINQLADKTYNENIAFNQYINKYEQVKNLHSDAFHIPKYILATTGCKYEDITSRLGNKVVAKGLESSMGIEIFLIRNKSDLLNLQERFGLDKEWLFEEFIEQSYGRDMRFYSIRGKAEACMIRKSARDFRANVALGASVEAFEITPQIQKIASDIYEQTGLDFLGIDLMFGDEKPYFCEINVMPGIEGIEKATGINVANRIMSTIKGDFIG